jgi:hypothetical protein
LDPKPHSSLVLFESRDPHQSTQACCILSAAMKRLVLGVLNGQEFIMLLTQLPGSDDETPSGFKIAEPRL